MGRHFWREIFSNNLTTTRSKKSFQSNFLSHRGGRQEAVWPDGSIFLFICQYFAFTTKSICPKSIFCQSGFKITPNTNQTYHTVCLRLLKFGQSGEISQNLVTLPPRLNGSIWANQTAPGFESQAQHLRFFDSYLNCDVWRTKNKQ